MEIIKMGSVVEDKRTGEVFQILNVYTIDSEDHVVFSQKGNDNTYKIRKKEDFLEDFEEVMTEKQLDNLFSDITNILMIHNIEPFQQICDEIEAAFNKYEEVID